MFVGLVYIRSPCSAMHAYHSTCMHVLTMLANQILARCQHAMTSRSAGSCIARSSKLRQCLRSRQRCRFCRSCCFCRSTPISSLVVACYLRSCKQVGRPASQPASSASVSTVARARLQAPGRALMLAASASFDAQLLLLLLPFATAHEFATISLQVEKRADTCSLRAREDKYSYQMLMAALLARMCALAACALRCQRSRSHHLRFLSKMTIMLAIILALFRADIAAARHTCRLARVCARVC